jgi:hemerythrin
MDDQHRRLMDCISDLHSSMRAGKARYWEGAGRLVDYTRTHFAEEERLMEAHGYPEIKAQKEAHEKLKRQVTEIQQKFRKGRRCRRTCCCSSDWLINHIRDGQKYGPCPADAERDGRGGGAGSSGTAGTI